MRAIRLYPSGELLQSLAADDDFRGRGPGQQLTAAVLAAARESGVRVAYLLMRIGGFRPRLGLEPIAGADAPADAGAPVEFTPASAIVTPARLERRGLKASTTRRSCGPSGRRST